MRDDFRAEPTSYFNSMMTSNHAVCWCIVAFHFSDQITQQCERKLWKIKPPARRIFPPERAVWVKQVTSGAQKPTPTRTPGPP